MTKEDIENRYNQLVNSIEKKEMYDGRGTVDRYTCDTCGHIIYTTYRDKGVTPYTIRCNRCGGTKYHDKTYDKKTVPSYVMITDWYRPSLIDVLKMSDGMIEHILNGGLILDEPSTIQHTPIIFENKPVLIYSGPFHDGKKRRRERRKLERNKKL